MDWRTNLINDSDGARAVLKEVKRVAVLGIKTEQHSRQPAFYVAKYLVDAGLDVVPVPVYYPTVTEILNRPVYRKLTDIPGDVDLVDVFRRPEDIDQHLEDLLAKKPRVVWFQLGIRNDAAAEKLAQAGIQVVQDRCLMVEHRRFKDASSDRRGLRPWAALNRLTRRVTRAGPPAGQDPQAPALVPAAQAPAFRLPGPAPVPLLGDFGTQLRFFSSQLRGLTELARHGVLVGAIRNNFKHIFAFSPEYVGQILSNPSLFYNAEISNMAPPNSALGRLWKGLVTINGDTHKQQRKLMLPAFHKKRVESYRDDMVVRFEELLARYRPGEIRDVASDMMSVTLMVVTKALFGLEDDRETLEIGTLMSDWLTQFTSLTNLLLPFDKPLFPYRRLLRLSERGEAAIRSLVDRRRAQGANGDDVLSVLLQARYDDGGMLSDAELVGQANILFIAGHETTSHTMTWLLFLLEQHPEVLGSLVDEIEGTVRGGAPSVEQLETMPLLDRVIKEAMRLFPAVPFSTRFAQGPFEMGGQAFETGTQVSYSPYITHRLPDLYPEPQRFNPDRWLNNNPGVYGYLPFSSGPRRCIGATMAMLEMKLLLAMMLPRFRLQLAPKTRIDARVSATLRAKQGMPMRVHAQDHRFARTLHLKGNVHEIVTL